MSELEAYKKYLGDQNLSDEEVLRRYNQEKENFNSEVNKVADGYDKLDMDLFIKRIGGQEKINQMKQINEAADKLKSVYGNVSKKEEEIKKIETMENIEEWKKGFMDGFEEAYKRIYGK